ncbi:DNA polymerase alpha, subunit B [Fomitiporia mediterranea MF3/22]|uniref:DNA polymerase alpha, subunit B n=1 Tax=Fomitiporia mediterranea (strain MF3/22) TaxID=694068 RepID=UPI000440773B|nr:DNA polymerase alpha, subunit B [Fomitiporia mediterranea MF3/22]EJD04429.1 DNA polymerase alpha, subunit B [Fomitiporia mediterranea MF3/22]
MSEAAVRKDLLEKIPDLENDDKLLSECVSICTDYNISGEDFFYQWESLVFNPMNSMRDAQKPTFVAAHAESIKKKLINDVNARRAKEQKEQSAAQKRNALMAGMLRKSAASRSTQKTPLHGSSTPSSKTTDRYMHEKTSERSEILDDRIDEFAELIREHYNIDDLGDPSSTSEDNIVTVGRICIDVDAATSAKLTGENIFLETSRMMGSGSRISLRFSANLKLRGAPQGAGSAGLFSGAIVALRGRNGGGNFFAVDEILALPSLTPSPEPADHKAFTLVMACGPYTSDSDLGFKQLGSLMEKLLSSKPSVLVLLGPFLDIAHPIIKSGDIDEMPLDIFHRCFVEPLRSFLHASPESLVLVEPSIRDLLSDHPVYPQCEFDNNLFADPRVKMIPNPCRFSINDVSFGSTSVDVLFHLRNQEYAQRGTPVDPVPPVSPESSGADPLTNACRHLLSQRSFYPIFPVPADLSSDVNLDVSHSGGLRLDTSNEQHAPDVIFLPSKLKQFAKMADGTWAINPSFLTKGTYASISVPDTPRAGLRAAIQCEIVKL